MCLLLCETDGRLILEGFRDLSRRLQKAVVISDPQLNYNLQNLEGSGAPLPVARHRFRAFQVQILLSSRYLNRYIALALTRGDRKLRKLGN